jgi:SHS2 domain-containing protein
MKQFEIIDISGDAGIRVFGEDLKELFENAASGMYSLITGIKDIEEKKQIEISAENISIDGLLVSYLNELIFHFDTYGFIGKKTTITEFVPSEFRLKAEVIGEDFDVERHEQKLLLKAATYHRLKIVKKEGIYQADIVFDI